MQLQLPILAAIAFVRARPTLAAAAPVTIQIIEGGGAAAATVGATLLLGTALMGAAALSTSGISSRARREGADQVAEGFVLGAAVAENANDNGMPFSNVNGGPSSPGF